VIAVEVVRQVRRARGWVALSAMAGLSLVLTAVIAGTRPAIAERIGDWGSVITNTSGFTTPFITLNALLLFFFPLAVAVFAGEPVAAEAEWGSLRYVLARPIPRWRVLGAKALVAAGFSVAAVVIAVAVSLVVGVVLFGWRPLTVLDLQHTTPFHVASATFSAPQALGRLGLATAFVIATLSSTFAFSLVLSTVTARPFSAVAGGVGLSLFSRALDNVPGLHALGSWLPVTDAGTTAWTGLLTTPSQLGAVGHELIVQALYGGVLLAAAFVWFTRADVLA
jgi:ABC-2 type transport system permease protein